MKIAYLMLVHEQPSHFKRLIKVLESESVNFFVHIDQKSNISQFSGSYPHTTFLENRVRVSRGGFSQTQAMIDLIKVASVSQDFDYYFFFKRKGLPIKR